MTIFSNTKFSYFCFGLNIEVLSVKYMFVSEHLCMTTGNMIQLKHFADTQTKHEMNTLFL